MLLGFLLIVVVLVLRSAGQFDELGPYRLREELQFAHPEMLAEYLEVQVCNRHENIPRLMRTILDFRPLSIKEFSCHEREPPFL
jgi:hypothetical protein